MIQRLLVFREMAVITFDRSTTFILTLAPGGHVGVTLFLAGHILCLTLPVRGIFFGGRVIGHGEPSCWNRSLNGKSARRFRYMLGHPTD